MKKSSVRTAVSESLFQKIDDNLLFFPGQEMHMAIPVDAQKPKDARIKSGKYVKCR